MYSFIKFDKFNYLWRYVGGEVFSTGQRLSLTKNLLNCKRGELCLTQVAG